MEDATEGVVAGVSSTGKSIRGATARNHRTKELREREEKREKGRSDAAGKRKGRAERKFGDGKTWSRSNLVRVDSLQNPTHQKNLSLALLLRKMRTTFLLKHPQHQRHFPRRAPITRKPVVHLRVAAVLVEINIRGTAIGPIRPRILRVLPLQPILIARKKVMHLQGSMATATKQVDHSSRGT